MPTVLVSDPEPTPPTVPSGASVRRPMLTIVTRKTPDLTMPPKDSQNPEAHTERN